MAPPTLEYYFDFSCPYAYLGFTQSEALARATGAILHYRPMLLGGVFRATGAPDVPADAMSPARARYNRLDMQRWADHWNVPLHMPAAHPMRTVLALRTLLGLPEAHWPVAIAAIYRGYWEHGVDIAEPSVLDQQLCAAGLARSEVTRALRCSGTPEIKEELRERTAEAVARGVFGAPTLFVSRPGRPAQMFWGQDRLDMVAAACGGDAAGAPAPAPAAATGSGPGSPTVEFWYDFASPFAYLGATQIEAVAAAAGAQLRWRPMLLGAVFRALGTPDVPLHAMPAARRAYVALELERWAGHWQVPLRFPPRFPQRTVTALRLALLAGDRIAALSHALFRAMWVDGHDLESPETLARILEAERFDRALLTAAGSEAARQELRASTEEAIARGIFGAPTFAVAPPAGSSGEARELLFWGQDRLAFVARALAGWRPRGE